METLRTALRFIRRCWTGEDLTTATMVGGTAMLIAILWSITTLVATAVHAAGFGEPLPIVAGVAVSTAYVCLGYVHDSRARQRRAASQLSRARTALAVRAFGVERLVTGRGRVVAADVDGLGQPRRLWRFDDPDGGAQVVAVEVTNSTPESDGTRRSYFLRVPPHVRTCQAAVAWTFGLRADEYRPVAEA